MAKPPIQFIVSVDVEEDSWGQYRNLPHPTRNVYRLSSFQDLCSVKKVKPTYLVTYPVAVCDDSRKVIRDLATGECEIGSHLHPWCTPPAGTTTAKRDSMLCNISSALQLAKLTSLTQRIESAFEVRPTAFRAGRWGIGPVTAAHLEQLNYVVDSSICPLTDWSSCCGPDFSTLSSEDVWMSISAPLGANKVYRITEIPPTIGFLQKNKQQIDFLYRLSRYQATKKLRLAGVLERVGLLNRVWLSPELSTTAEMLALCQRMVSNGSNVLNMTFHSLSLEPGLGPFVKTSHEHRVFLDKLRTIIDFVMALGATPMTLTEAAKSMSTDGLSTYEWPQSDEAGAS